MCEPTSAVLAITAIAGALSAYSQVQTGKANAAIANANADAQEQAGRDAVNTGNDQAYQQRMQAKQVAGKQTVSLASGGADLTSGNALDLTTETSQFGQLDALTTINNAQRQAAGLQFQAGVSRAQGKLDRQTSNLGAATTLLNSVSKGYGAYKTLGGTGLSDSMNTKTTGGYGNAWNNYLKGSL